MRQSITDLAMTHGLTDAQVDEFVEFVHTNHYDRIVLNPDISASSAADLFTLDLRVSNVLLRTFLRPQGVPTSVEIDSLKLAATRAIAAYYAASNVSGAYDHNYDMAIGGEAPTSPQHFCTDLDFIRGTIEDDFATDTLLVELKQSQRRLAAEIVQK